MDERIKKLAEQAIANVRFWKGCNQESYGVDEQELAKFAELIVQECCRALHPMLRDMISRGHGVDLIKEHFGDKE